MLALATLAINNYNSDILAIKGLRITLMSNHCLLQFFGFLAMIVYGIDAFFKFKAWRAGEIAQGERVRNVTTRSEPVTPAY